ncbi:uncharacterized protein BX664DRAFT_342576 [Halteromyces radiatus]|uniref:uncharacterized protein n=1 Tax=Halteromyces radiatus TaxID=101107 RepID=UPI00221E75B7|nr:uncharacterized protein BX664DRAFT_342576 [Halteromyces radiatus]KAI8078731.1 hypothetical protein BX664DRAFT_342576 [Halteromyces radiatus]
MATNEPQINTPRKKRVKIVSACGECRRRKTKCNGELPCRSCHKADVPCVYPAVSHAEDKRNHISKAALEAIEDRLKAIEDMLHTILRSQSFVAELPAAAVSQFLNNKESPSSSLSLPRSYDQKQPQQSSSSSFTTLTSTQQRSHSSLLRSPPTQLNNTSNNEKDTKDDDDSKNNKNISTIMSSPDVRLPSIHDLSVHPIYSAPLAEIKQEKVFITDLPPPLGYTSYYNCRSEIGSDVSNETILASIKKRKRS